MISLLASDQFAKCNNHPIRDMFFAQQVFLFSGAGFE